MSITVRFDFGKYGLSQTLSSTYDQMFSLLEKLSSGKKINWAGDAPSTLIISERLQTQIAALNQEIENTTQLIHKYETASSYVSEMRSKLTELRTLAVGAANEGINDETMQAAYATEADAIVQSYNDLLKTASYNGALLFDGSEGALGELTELQGIDLSTPEAAQNSLQLLDQTIEEIDNFQTELGATQKNELEAHVASLQITTQNLEAANSILLDTDYAQSYSSLMGELIKFQAAAALFAHSNMTADSVLLLLNG